MRLIPDTCNHDRKKAINNNLANVSCKRWWYFASHPHNNLLTITHN